MTCAYASIACVDISITVGCSINLIWFLFLIFYLTFGLLFGKFVFFFGTPFYVHMPICCAIDQYLSCVYCWRLASFFLFFNASCFYSLFIVHFIINAIAIVVANAFDANIGSFYYVVFAELLDDGKILRHYKLIEIWL